LCKIEEEDKVATCPNCQNAIVDKGKFYGCTGYSKGCKFSLPKKWSGKTLTQKNVQDLIEKKKTSKIKNFKSKKGNRYSAYLLLTDDYKIDMEFS
jgi:DNA topoisomerase-3